MTEVLASDGLRLYAESHGAGIPVVFSCGYCTTSENFRAQVDPLTAAGAKVILWDYRGHGRSDAPEDPESYSLEIVLDDLQRVLAWATPDRPAVLAGHSLGGLVSLHTAVKHPDCTAGLVMIDSGPGFKNAEAQAGWTAQVERTAFFLESRGMQALIDGKGAATAIGRRKELPAAQAAARAIAAQNPKAVANFGRRVSGPPAPVIDELVDIRVPALVIVGEADDPYLRAGEVMAERLPNAEFQMLAGAGHVGNIEESDAFNRLVADFLKRIADRIEG